ncbi:MAG: sodium/proline symporter, partial [Planctomycetes bacterium]|nr:sodium/proline symporter [Planctomycetota bacterium]
MTFNFFEITSFLLYLVMVLAIGFYFFGKKLNVDEYLLGGKSMGKWVTAISAQASDMSGWLLMGLPGAVYLFGLSEAWIAIGLASGTILNWKFIAPRLRAYTGKTNSLTLPHFFEKRFADPTGLLRIIAALITLFFFTIYAASGLNATAKLFETMFNVDFHFALIAGGICIIIYTFMGGYLAVCWTDLIQGILMVIAIVVVPLMALNRVGGFAGVEAVAAAEGIRLSLWPAAERPLLSILSTAAWGLGYCGMPHILARFMSVGKIQDLRPAMWIASIWVVISLTFAVVVGFIGIAAVPGLKPPMHETVFIQMARNAFHP